MKITIRSKLVLAISTLMVVVFAAAAYMFISEKKVELADDIHVNTLAFSRLTAPKIVEDYDLYLAQNSFVYFNREVSQLFEQNDDVEGVQVVSYDGELLYDSSVDVSKKYDGERFVEDAFLDEQVKSENIFVQLEDGRGSFLKVDETGGIVNVDINENPVQSFEPGVLIEYFVVPANDKYSVVYFVSYENLDARIATMVQRIGYLTAFAMMLGMLFAFLLSTNLVRPVKKLVGGVTQIAKGNFDARVDVKTHDEMKYLGDAFNQMAVDLKKSLEARVYKERVGKELEIAVDIQKTIIPKELPTVAGLDVSARIIPAAEVGGDMYDLIDTGQGRYLMYLGDVTGHGVPAGIVSSISNALFYAYSGEADLVKLIVNVNRVLAAKTMKNMFMTLCLMEWDCEAGKFSFVNAGHEKLIHYKAAEKKASFIDQQGIALGMIPDISGKVQESNVELAAGDFVVVYSDGLPEAWKNEKENYGMEKLVATVEAAADRGSASEVEKAILADISSFTAGYEQKDDMTIMVIRRS